MNRSHKNMDDDDDDDSQANDRRKRPPPAEPGAAEPAEAVLDNNNNHDDNNMTGRNVPSNNASNIQMSSITVSAGGSAAAASDSSTLTADRNAAAAATAAAVAAAPKKRAGRKRMRTTEDGVEQKMPHQQRWDEMFERLKVYKAKYGHCNVPNRYTGDTQLGSWVSAQRRQFRIITHGESGSAALTPERANKLIQLGFQWSTTNPHHTPWEVRYEGLKAFVKRFGHSEVPMRWTEDPKLSHWVSKQRHDFKLRQENKSGRMTDEKIKLLNDVGFRWEGSRRSIQEKVQAINPAPGAPPTNITNSTAGTAGAAGNRTSESSNNNNSASSNPSLDLSEIAAAAFANTFTPSASPHVAAAGAPAQSTEQSRQQQSVRDFAASANTQNALQNAANATATQPGQQGPANMQQLFASLGASNQASQQQAVIQQLGPLLALSQQILAASTNAATGNPQAPSLEQMVSSMIMGGQQNVNLMQAQQPMWPAAFNPMAAASAQQQQLQAGNANLSQLLSSFGAPAAFQVPQANYQQIMQQAALQQALSATNPSRPAANANDTTANSSNQYVLVVPLNGSTAQPSVMQMNLQASQAAAGGGGSANPFLLNYPQYMVGNPQATAGAGYYPTAGAANAAGSLTSGTAAGVASGAAEAPFNAGAPTSASAAPDIQQHPGGPGALIMNQSETSDGASTRDQQQQREGQGSGGAGRGSGSAPNLDPPVN